MNHLIKCSKCGIFGLFEYSDKTHKCLYEKCDGNEFEIDYTPDLLKKIIDDYRKEAISKPKPFIFKKPIIQKVHNGWVCVPQ